MQGSLGEKIGEGATADIHVWAPGQIVKLFKAGVPPRLGRHEARMTRAVFAAGGPAPEVLGKVTVEGRFGVVLPRLDGPTLLEQLLARAMTYAQVGFVTNHGGMHTGLSVNNALNLATGTTAGANIGIRHTF